MHTCRAVKTSADVCSYIDWRKIWDEFKCLDQGHFLTLLILNYGKKRTVSVVVELSDENLNDVSVANCVRMT